MLHRIFNLTGNADGYSRPHKHYWTSAWICKNTMVTVRVSSLIFDYAKTNYSNISKKMNRYGPNQYWVDRQILVICEICTWHHYRSLDRTKQSLFIQFLERVCIHENIGQENNLEYSLTLWELLGRKLQLFLISAPYIEEKITEKEFVSRYQNSVLIFCRQKLANGRNCHCLE